MNVQHSWYRYKQDMYIHTNTHSKSQRVCCSLTTSPPLWLLTFNKEKSIQDNSFYLRPTVSVMKTLSVPYILYSQCGLDRVSGLYITYCRHQQYHLTRAAVQKQINTEDGKQMNLKMCTSSGHIGLFPQCQSQQSNGPDVAKTHNCFPPQQPECVCTTSIIWKKSNLL